MGLFQFIKEIGFIVEIGSFEGKSTICLAGGSKDGNRIPVYAIDPHGGTVYHSLDKYGVENTLSIFRENIRKAQNVLVRCRKVH